MPPASPPPPASTTMPRGSRLARTAASPPLRPKMNVPARLRTRISVGSKPCGTSIRRGSWPNVATGRTMKEEGMATTGTIRVLGGLDAIMAGLEDLYRDVHAHPELSMQEHRTAEKAAARLEASRYEVTTGVGSTGVVGVLANGDGPTVMLRADMDALPVKEATALPYASTATASDPDGNEVPVMHACGHDMHVTWLAGTTALLAGAREAWHGTVLAVFQPP